MKTKKSDENYLVEFTNADRAILESYKNTLDGLAEYYGKSYEIVLHSLEKNNNAVVKIINGFHTGRKVGSPITDLAIDMLSHIQNDCNHKTYECYFSTNNQGEPLKSTTIAIFGTENKIIGLLCINFYMSTPFSEVINGFISKDNIKKEHFLEISSDEIKNEVKKASLSIKNNKTIAASLINKNIIILLHEKGIFKMKNAVEIVAKELDISKNTVYMHLRNIENLNK